MTTWRVMRSGGAAGARNMALDEALLGTALAGHTLRLYWFDPPCLSIGAHQPLDEVDLDGCARYGVAVVRRPTGGRAVLHQGDLTYALVGPAGGAVFADGVLASYRRIGAALTAACTLLGLMVESDGARRGLSGPSCFAAAAPYEPLVGGEKVAGSAQLRRGAAVLQHGSLRLTDPRVPTAALLRERRPGQRLPADPPSLSALLGRTIERDEAAAALLAAFATRFAVEPLAAALTPEEAATAMALEQRYRGAAWTARRAVSGTPAS